MRSYLYLYDGKEKTYDEIYDPRLCPFELEFEGRTYWALWSAIRSATYPKRWGLLCHVSLVGARAMCWETNYIFLTQQEAEAYANWLNYNEVHPDNAQGWWAQHRQEF